MRGNSPGTPEYRAGTALRSVQKNKKPPSPFNKDGSASYSVQEQLILLRFFVLFGRCFHIACAVLLLEPLDSAGGIYELLFACVERMAHRAYLGVDFLCRAARLECVSTAAVNDYFLVLWVYIFLHVRKAPILAKP